MFSLSMKNVQFERTKCSGWAYKLSSLSILNVHFDNKNVQPDLKASSVWAYRILTLIIQYVQFEQTKCSVWVNRIFNMSILTEFSLRAFQIEQVPAQVYWIFGLSIKSASLSTLKVKCKCFKRDITIYLFIF